MKKLFTLSAITMMASGAMVMAQNFNVNEARLTSSEAKAMVEARRANKTPRVAKKATDRQLFNVTSGQSARIQNLGKRNNIDASVKNAKMVAPMATKAPMEAGVNVTRSEAAASALYSLPEGTYCRGMYWSQSDGEEGFFRYNLPLTYTGSIVDQTYTARAGSMWTVGASDGDASEYVVDGNYVTSYGMGMFYMPKIWNGTTCYYYGAAKSTAGYSIVESAMETEPQCMAMYNMYDNENIYTGFSNTFAFGSRDFINTNNVHVQSDAMLVTYTKPSNPLVIDHFNALGLSESATPIANDDYVGMTIVTTDDAGELVYYRTVITADDVQYYTQNTSTGDYIFNVSGYFSEEVDGFPVEYTPVLTNEFDLYLYNFKSENVNLGFEMCWYDDNNASPRTDDFPTHSYYDVYNDGVAQYDGEFVCDPRVDAVVNLMGYYNCLIDANAAVGVIPAEGGVAVTLVEEGKEYNDFDVYSTFTLEDMEIDTISEWLSFQVDTSYYADMGCYLFYLGAEALPEGVAGRDGLMTLSTNGGTATCTLRVSQGTTGISSVESSSVAYKAVVNGDAIEVACPSDVKVATLYNAAGVLVKTVNVVNGKATIEGAANGLNIVNFGGKQSVKVIK